MLSWLESSDWKIVRHLVFVSNTVLNKEQLKSPLSHNRIFLMQISNRFHIGQRRSPLRWNNDEERGTGRKVQVMDGERLLLKSTWHVSKIGGRWSLRCERSAIPNHFWALLDDVLNYKRRSNPPTIRVRPRYSSEVPDLLTLAMGNELPALKSSRKPTTVLSKITTF